MLGFNPFLCSSFTDSSSEMTINLTGIENGLAKLTLRVHFGHLFRWSHEYAIGRTVVFKFDRNYTQDSSTILLDNFYNGQALPNMLY